ncbi:MAG: DUF3798 domain-containing protein [Eubacterium sp.]|nr:DUF3798 domain-containing protein [Eubacterium sp.]
MEKKRLKVLSFILIFALSLLMTGCGETQDNSAVTASPGITDETKNGDGNQDDTDNTNTAENDNSGNTDDDNDSENNDGNTTDNFHIGIVTGSISQSEDDRRGAEAFQEKYGAENVTLAIYPDNFSDELDTTIQTIVNLADDPDMKAIIVNQAVDGTTEAFRQIKSKRPDILCLAGEAYEDYPDIGAVSDLVVGNDFLSRGYLMIHTAHELGCDTFVHISFPRHLSYESVYREVAIMKAACKKFRMNFRMETAPDPTTDVGVPGAQKFIRKEVPKWIKKYGQKSAYFCTNDAHTEPLIEMLLKCGGYFIEADLPSPLMGYPGALDLDLNWNTGDFGEIQTTVENAVVERGGAGRFGTWTYSYGYALSAGLAEHARNVILGESEMNSIDDLSRAFGAFSPGSEWNGSRYTDAGTGKKSDNIILVYQDTYIMGNPGYYAGSTKVKVPGKYFKMGEPEG